MRSTHALIALLATSIAAAQAGLAVAREFADPGNATAEHGAGRPSPAHQGSNRYGPFLVMSETTAALTAQTDRQSPIAFLRMLADHPRVKILLLKDCPGTVDDVANLRLGRMIRARAISTRVPATGSVRSGAVELFIAGASRQAARDAEFAVHSWLDNTGRGPGDLGANAPVNTVYLAYYQDMGLSPSQARAFYSLTNSVPNNRVLWLSTSDIARYVPLTRAE